MQREGALVPYLNSLTNPPQPLDDSPLQSSVAADFKALEEYCQFHKLRHALDRSVFVHAAQAEAVMSLARSQGAAAPALGRAIREGGGVSEGAGAVAPGSGSCFVSQSALLRALAAPSADAASAADPGSWEVLATQVGILMSLTSRLLFGCLSTPESSLLRAVCCHIYALSH